VPTKFDNSDPLYEKIMATHDAAVTAGLTEYKDPKTGLNLFSQEDLDKTFIIDD
jgi:hypothetical protein